MASESTDERTVSVSIPKAVDDWLDEQAATLDVDRETLLVQLIASYRQLSSGDGERPTIDEALLAETVEEDVTALVEDHVDAVLEAKLENGDVELDQETITEQVSEATSSVQRQLGNRIDSLEADYTEKLQDVRERVIQVKREADAKAAKDHEHSEFQALETLQAEVESLDAELTALQDAYEETVPDHSEELEAIDDRLETVEDRLQTVAWVVSDLRDAIESSGGLEAVDRIKRAAAKADIDRAVCERCGDSVAVALLTDPKCPHCDATVSNIEPAGGWFGKPKLLAAQQLESGDQS